jgi:hypothetical protein
LSCTSPALPVGKSTPSVPDEITLCSTTARPPTSMPSLPSRTVKPTMRVSGPAADDTSTVSVVADAPAITVPATADWSPVV